jgi:secreted trypsin-like serine protease
VVTGSDDTHDPLAQIEHVSDVITAPGADLQTLNPDAAVLVLDQPTSAPKALLGGWPSPRAPAVFGGFGVVGAAERITGTARELGMRLEPATECRISVHSGGLCAVTTPSEPSGPCSGDSGGPLLAGRPERLVGIFSRYTLGCAGVEPALFTALAPLRVWLARVIDEHP